MSHWQLIAGFLILSLSGCTAIPTSTDTTPSPVEVVPPSNFQARLVDVRAGASKALEGSVSAPISPVVGSGGGQQETLGDANGCILTTLGTPPSRMKALLKTQGGCWARIRYDDSGQDDVAEAP